MQEQNSVEAGNEQGKGNDQAGFCQRAVSNCEHRKKGRGCIGDRECGGGADELGAVVGVAVDGNEE